MEKIDAFKKEYYRDPQVIAMMTTKFVTRYQIWNYLKAKDQVFDLNWQIVRYDVLKTRLICYWEKQKIFMKTLSIHDLFQISNNSSLIFNEQERNLINIKLENLLDKFILKKSKLHVSLIHYIIDALNAFKKIGFSSRKIISLQHEIQSRMKNLLKVIVGSKVISKSQMKLYLNLKNINFTDPELQQIFNEHFHQDKRKYILNTLRTNLFKNYQFEF